MDDAETSSSEPPPRSGDTDDPARSITFDLLDPDGLLSDEQRAAVGELARSALERLEAAGELRARVVNDEAMAEAHARYAGVEGTTDVLTFDLGPNGSVDADLYICVDEARRQAGRLGHAVEHELVLYIIHGLLHCLGHDDLNEEDARRMHAEEDRLLTAIGIGPVFSGAGASARVGESEA